MNMISLIPEQNSHLGYVIVNTRTSRPLYFTGIFESIGRNMSADLEDAYVFGTRREAKAYQALNALVDDLDIHSYEVRRRGFGFRARQIARAILSNQRIQDIVGFAALCLFAFNAIIWLAILSSWRGV